MESKKDSMGWRYSVRELITYNIFYTILLISAEAGTLNKKIQSSYTVLWFTCFQARQFTKLNVLFEPTLTLLITTNINGYTGPKNYTLPIFIMFYSNADDISV